MLYLSKLESKLDESLSKETRESLTEWIGHKRNKPLNQNKMKQTAMQMAINHYKKLSEQGSNQAYVVAKFLEENFLEVEKQQIIDFTDNYVDNCVIPNENMAIPTRMDVPQYYNETFKSE